MTKENSHIYHCYDNLVAMATINNYFSLVLYSSLLLWWFPWPMALIKVSI